MVHQNFWLKIKSTNKCFCGIEWESNESEAHTFTHILYGHELVEKAKSQYGR